MSLTLPTVAGYLATSSETVSVVRGTFFDTYEVTSPVTSSTVSTTLPTLLPYSPVWMIGRVSPGWPGTGASRRRPGACDR